MEEQDMTRFEVQVYSPTARKYKTARNGSQVYSYATWGAAKSRERFVSGKTRVKEVAATV